MRALTATILAGVLALVLGCDAEKRAARAIDEARAAKADVYAPTEMKRAEEALARARAAQREERSRALLEAREHATAAAARAASLLVEATAKGERQRELAERRKSAVDEQALLAVEDARARAHPPHPLPDGATTLSPAEAWARASRDNLLFLDVRPPLLSGDARPRTAIAAPLPVLRHARYPTALDLILLDELGGSQVLADAVASLRERGYARLFVVEGGFAAWRDAGLPLDSDGGHAPTIRALLPEDLARELAERRVVVVDARAPSLWHAGRVPGSLNIPPARLPDAAGGELRGQRVVVYAANDEMALRAARALVDAGLRDVGRLVGGLPAWGRANQRVDATPRTAMVTP